MLEKLPQESEELLGIPIPPDRLAALEAYAGLLVRWNDRFNLTAVRDPEGIRVRHFLDSLSCLSMMPDPIGRLVDVGTGAGFPGLVLKIVRPEIELALVESVEKKAGFCRVVVEELGLEGVTVLTERAETLGQDPDHRETYDWAIARAVAATPVLAEYLLPLVRVGGHALAQKGADGLEEAGAAAGAVKTLGGELKNHREVRFPGVPEAHTLLVFEKVRHTPEKYPRRVGIPTKRPL
ncbi:MAG TPA: 16S rRNA (guanine(527)-N(7))-methyltransferase RsmG [Anaerolineales bacterium]|nr:16S rRNA (guanine(527)-N(7))-methyltransferase RsmG [Anaerolineales bacterium]